MSLLISKHYTCFKEMNYITGTLCSDGDCKQARTHYSSSVQTLARGDKKQKKTATQYVRNVSHKREERIIF
jgi:hypothetical protein